MESPSDCFRITRYRLVTRIHGRARMDGVSKAQFGLSKGASRWSSGGSEGMIAWWLLME
ncbi:hypothetical protein COLO4_34895 [Corchorus olitorius]|uniref:Uncharacterized protein n=1 Tax=Corchorus olitorius TaxID=93759 RepID=A0A1R3GJ39_9ROSI|nr:hypothetical protein COLO4_34895 [Corchorus olitorius]